MNARSPVTVIDKRRRDKAGQPIADPPAMSEAQDRAVSAWVVQQAGLAWWTVQGLAQRGEADAAAEVAARRGQLLAEAVAKGVSLR